jgi:hypothetical protein
MTPKEKSKKVDHPVYDPDWQQLWAKGRLIKKFRQPAGNQESLLLEFETLRWPAVIDDPLPRVTGTPAEEATARRDPEAQSRPTDRSLFRDGTGRRIGWKWP